MSAVRDSGWRACSQRGACFCAAEALPPWAARAAGTAPIFFARVRPAGGAGSGEIVVAFIDTVDGLCGTRTLKVSNFPGLMRRGSNRVCFAWCGQRVPFSLLPHAGRVRSSASSRSGRAPRGPRPEAARWRGAERGSSEECKSLEFSARGWDPGEPVVALGRGSSGVFGQ